MNLNDLHAMYDFTGRTIVITGGAGVLGGEMACALAGCNANVVIMDRDPALADRLKVRLESTVGKAMIVYGDVLRKETLVAAADAVLREFGSIDALINAAGGNNPQATAGPAQSFFDLPEEGLRRAADLNLLGTFLPSQVFGKYFAEKKQGTILNIASMAGIRPLTRVVAYSAAKAAVANFTQWLAVYMAQEYSPAIRVNAIAPGFFLTDQNRFLLTEKETGTLTARGKRIVDHTPMARFGEPDDLLGTMLWLLSPASRFVTGIVVPVDGGFSAYGGV
jgi:NAD(P)-dependent dehydrogenase (short-subunit alcohol dehydrogenase family)